MSNQREIYEALLAGETLISDTQIKVKLGIAGNLINANHNSLFATMFARPYEWQIYKEPKWCENIPDGGVLCWCSITKNARNKFIDNITRYEDDSFKGGDVWSFATP